MFTENHRTNFKMQYYIVSVMIYSKWLIKSFNQYINTLFLLPFVIGMETITPECRRQDDGSPAPESKCDVRSKPPIQQFPCKDTVCPPV